MKKVSDLRYSFVVRNWRCPWEMDQQELVVAMKANGKILWCGDDKITTSRRTEKEICSQSSTVGINRSAEYIALLLWTIAFFWGETGKQVRLIVFGPTKSHSVFLQLNQSFLK